MGTYTSTQGFYKPDPDEFVDVEAQINYNWRRADSRVKQLVEWQYIPGTYLNVGDAYASREAGMKFYKASSNMVTFATNSTGTLAQDSNSKVYSWSSSGVSFYGGYQSENSDEQKFTYRIDTTDGMIHLRGGVKLNSGADQIPRNTNITIINLPFNARPSRNKYFYVHMGIVSSNFSCCRVLVMATTGDIEINRMGADQTDPTQRVVSFNDISYPVND